MTCAVRDGVGLELLPALDEGDGDGDGDRVPPDGWVVGRGWGEPVPVDVGRPVGRPDAVVVGRPDVVGCPDADVVGWPEPDGAGLPDVVGPPLADGLVTTTGTMTVRMIVEQVTVLAPAFPVPLHWLTVIGIARLIREGRTVHLTVAAAPPFPDPSHWVTVALVVLAGNGEQCGVPVVADPTHW